MAELDLTDGFDVHEHRHALKLLRQDEGSMTLENRDGLSCPVCERPFDRLFVTERRDVSFSSAPSGPLCLVRTDGQLIVVTH
ncbi:MAG: flagella cluster protein [Halanaeroarchaeum sp.]